MVKRFQRQLLPGPQGWPIIGNALQIDPAVPHLTLEKWGKQFGGIYQIHMFMENWVLVTKYEYVYEMLVTKSFAFAGRSKSFRITLLTEGNKSLFTSDPTIASYQPSRKMIQKTVKQFGDGMSKLETILSVNMENLVTQVNSFGGKAIDIRDTIYNFTVGTIYTLITGEETLEENEQLKMFKDLERAVTSSIGYGDSIELDTFPWLRFFRHPTYLKLVKALDLKRKLWNELWPKSLKTYEADKPNCMLHATADMINDKSASFVPELTEDFLRGIFLDFTNGGISTTTASIYALLNILLNYPQVIARLQEEVDRVTNSSRRPTFTDKDDMPYTMAVVYELLRYTSIVPTVGRQTLEDTSLGGYKLPRGTIVIPHFWAIHRDEEFWGDPEVFRPERFLEANGKLVPADHSNRKHLLTFGAGIRVCVGELFALRRLFIFTSYIAQSFNLLPDNSSEMVSCDPRKYAIGLVLSPPSYRMKLTCRN